MAADLVFRDGTVLTGSQKDPITDRIAVADGLIVAVGADADGLVGSATTVVDLAGGALLPGFADGHAHPLLGAIGLLGADVRSAATIDDMLAAVAAWAKSHPDDEWVVGDSFDPTLAAEGRFDARWLDRVVPDRPVALRSMDYHTLWVNSEALRRAGIDAWTVEPADGQIVRRTDGSPLGTLREWGAIKPVLELIPSKPLDQQVAALADVTGRFAAAGITWVQDAMVEPHHLPVWLAAATTDRLKVRANLGFSTEPGTWHESLGDFVDMRTRVAAEAPQWLTAGTIKFFADGVIEAGTAALLEPYADCPHSHGMANWSLEELTDALAAVDELGFQVHVHAIGDAGVQLALDAIEGLTHRNGPADRRPIIAHVQLVDPADLPRFAELGVIANLEPLWAQPDRLITELAIPRIGEQRGARQYQLRSLLDSGTHLSFGSDWPVTAFEPLLGIATAVTRQTPAGVPEAGWLPEERIPVAEALCAYTAGVAYQGFDEAERGIIEVGRRADLVHLSADPTAVPALDLHHVQVRGTWLGGQRTA